LNFGFVFPDTCHTTIASCGIASGSGTEALWAVRCQITSLNTAGKLHEQDTSVKETREMSATKTSRTTSDLHAASRLAERSVNTACANFSQNSCVCFGLMDARLLHPVSPVRSELQATVRLQTQTGKRRRRDLRLRTPWATVNSCRLKRRRTCQQFISKNSATRHLFGERHHAEHQREDVKNRSAGGLMGRRGGREPSNLVVVLSAAQINWLTLRTAARCLLR